MARWRSPTEGTGDTRASAGPLHRIRILHNRHSISKGIPRKRGLSPAKAREVPALAAPLRALQPNRRDAYPNSIGYGPIGWLR